MADRCKEELLGRSVLADRGSRLVSPSILEVIMRWDESDFQGTHSPLLGTTIYWHRALLGTAEAPCAASLVQGESFPGFRYEQEPGFL